jgi:hypothetical protein
LVQFFGDIITSRYKKYSGRAEKYTNSNHPKKNQQLEKQPELLCENIQ